MMRVFTISLDFNFPAYFQSVPNLKRCGFHPFTLDEMERRITIDGGSDSEQLDRDLPSSP